MPLVVPRIGPARPRIIASHVVRQSRGNLAALLLRCNTVGWVPKGWVPRGGSRGTLGLASLAEARHLWHLDCARDTDDCVLLEVKDVYW